MDNLYPAQPDLNDMVPIILTRPHEGVGVADEWVKAFEQMEKRKRQYLGIFWLAHTGRMIDSENRVLFDLTKPEAAAFMVDATGDEDHRNRALAKSTTEELHDMGLLRFNQIRECRTRGERKHTFRLQREILDPVQEMR